MSTQDPMHPFLQQADASPQVKFRPLCTISNAVRLITTYPKALLGLCVMLAALALIPLYLLACCGMPTIRHLFTQKTLTIVLFFLTILPVFLFMQAPDKAFETIKKRGFWAAFTYYMRTHFLTRANMRLGLFVLIFWTLSMVGLLALNKSVSCGDKPCNTSQSTAYVSVTKQTTTIYTESGPKTLERTTKVTPTKEETTETFQEKSDVLGGWGFLLCIATFVAFVRLIPFAGETLRNNAYAFCTAWRFTRGSFLRLWGGLFVFNISLQLINALVVHTLALLPSPLAQILLPMWLSLILSFTALMLALYVLLSHRFFLQYRTACAPIKAMKSTSASLTPKKSPPTRPAKKAPVRKKTATKKPPNKK